MGFNSAPGSGIGQRDINNEGQVRLEKHTEELKAYGLSGLEGRVQRGLDPAGMLAVGETRKIIEQIAAKSGIDMQEVDALTKDLHVGAIWSKSDDLAKAEKPEVKAWMLLADECHEVNDKDLSREGYLQDVDRIKGDLQLAEQDPETALTKAVERIVATAKEKFTMKNGVPFSEEDAFIHMAIAGEKYGVSKAGDLYFAGANQLDYSALEKEGLTAVEREDRGRMATFYQRDGQDVVKKLYPGFALVFGDEDLALKLAKSSENFEKPKITRERLKDMQTLEFEIQADFSETLKALNQEVGTELQPRPDGYHLTIIGPAESKILATLDDENIARLQQINEQIQKGEGITIGGIGFIDGASEKYQMREADKVKKTAFISLDIPALQEFRAQIGLPPKDFHLTLGFVGGDIHMQVVRQEPIKPGSPKMKDITAPIPKQADALFNKINIPDITYGGLDGQMKERAK